MSEDELSMDSEQEEHRSELRAKPREDSVEPKEENGAKKNKSQYSSSSSSENEEEKDPYDDDKVEYIDEKLEKKKKERAEKRKQKELIQEDPTYQQSKEIVESLMRPTKRYFNEEDNDDIKAKYQEEGQTLVAEMDKAFEVDQHSYISGKPSFERLKFLKKLEEKSKNTSLCKALIEEGAVERFARYLGGYSDGTPPSLNICESSFRILSTMSNSRRLADYMEGSIKGTGIVQVINRLQLNPDTKAYKLRETLIDHWRRAITHAESGYKAQSSMKFTSETLNELRQYKTDMEENQQLEDRAAAARHRKLIEENFPGLRQSPGFNPRTNRIVRPAMHGKHRDK